MKSICHALLILVGVLVGCSEQSTVEPASLVDESIATPVFKQTASKTKPNIIVVLADDMRTGYTSFEGHPIIKTPNLDDLAEKGTFFSNSFATSAACTPSRTSLLTGQYERRHGVNFNSDSALNNEAYRRTYPMLLKDAGYFVGYIGKNHTPVGENEDGIIGYDSGVMDKSFDYWYASHRHLGFYPKENPKHAIFKNAQADTQVEIMEEGVENFFTPDRAFSAGFDFIRSRPADKPFALLINFNVPHNAGTGSMKLRDSDLELYRETYRDLTQTIQLPSTYIAANDVLKPKLPTNVYNGEYISVYNYVKTTEGMLEREIRVMQSVTGIDKLMGKLVQQLEKQGIADNTIIVFTSDHGIQNGEFGLAGKVLVYEPSIKIPLIIYDPRGVVQSQRSELVALIDIAPTLLEFAELPVPDSMQGLSLKPLFENKNSDWREELFLENMMTIQNYPRIEAVRTRKWKYIRYFDKQKDQAYADMLVASINGEEPIYEELFDLENDPNEISNVIADDENKDIVDKLRQRVTRMVKKYRGNEPLNTLQTESRI